MKRKLHLPMRKKQHKNRIYPWKRVKTAAICVLLACNILLLAVSGFGKLQQTRTQSRTQKQMEAILAQKGIVCGSSVYQTLREKPQAYAMTMDSTQQEKLAQALLRGDVKAQPEKGNTTVWTGSNGTLSWSAAGDVTGEMELNDQVQPTSREDAEDMIYSLFHKALGISKDQVSGSQPDTDRFLVEVTQRFDDLDIIGIKLTVTILPDNQVSIQGKWYPGTPETLYLSALDSYSAEKVLFQFIAADTGIAQIISVQPVYVLSDKSGGRFTLLPCWRISADKGDYVINVLTGDVAASSEIGADWEITDAPDENTPDTNDIFSSTDSTDTGSGERTTNVPSADANSTNDTVDANGANNAQNPANSDDELDIAWDDEQAANGVTNGMADNGIGTAQKN